MPKGEKTKLLWNNSKYRKHMSDVHKGQKKSPNAYSFPKGHYHYPFKNVKHKWDFKGIFKEKNGYVWIYNDKKHPKQHDKNKQYIKKCVKVIENKMNRRLKKEEIVHHINGIKDDDRIENLWLFFSGKKHKAYHLRVNITYKKWKL